MEFNYLFILAGNYREYLHYASKYRSIGATTVYIRDIDSLLGMLESYRYIVVGTFEERSDANEIAEMIKITKGTHLFAKELL